MSKIQVSVVNLCQPGNANPLPHHVDYDRDSWEGFHQPVEGDGVDAGPHLAGGLVAGVQDCVGGPLLLTMTLESWTTVELMWRGPPRS